MGPDARKLTNQRLCYSSLECIIQTCFNQNFMFLAMLVSVAKDTGLSLASPKPQRQFL